MNKRRIQLYAVSVALVALVLMSQSGITSATPQVPNRILADTPVGVNPFIEALELIAAEDSAMIAQYYQLGGQRFFPLDHSQSAFDNLDLMYIISSNQANWRDYWPRSLWEFRDGATVLFQFSNQGLEDSLDDADEITTALNTWMGTNLDVLFGVYDELTQKTTVFYWGYMSPQNHSDFIIEEFYPVLISGGFTQFITPGTIANAPVSIVGTGLIKNETTTQRSAPDYWIPIAVTAFIQDNAITIDDNDVHNMSINTAFGFSGNISAAADSAFSAITFELPYVANVYDSYPETSNLYPELTGKFEWPVKLEAGTIYDFDHQYEDIYVTYDMAVEELETFPQISGDLSINVTALHASEDPMLNYTITMNNTGNEAAFNTEFIWDLEKKPEPEYIYVFDNDTYYFDDSLVKYYNFSSGELVDTLALTDIDHDNNVGTPNISISLEITGWFTNTSDGGSVVQPVTNYNSSLGIEEILFEETMALVFINQSFFSFNHSSNLVETTLDNGNFGLKGTINQLNPNEAETFWWSISDLPDVNDAFIILGYNASEGWITQDVHYQTNITFVDNTSEETGGITNLVDYLVLLAQSEGSDLRYPPINTEFIPGVIFRYSDSADREYFGWSNGLVIQLYDDEAILKTTVALNSTVYRIDDVAQIDVTVENIGDAPASNVQIQGFHAQLGPNWQLAGEPEAFTEETSLGTINPTEKATYTFYRDVYTFLGIHPVGFVVDYTTEESDGTYGTFNRTDIANLTSNLIISIVLPKVDKAGEDEPSYPTPEVNVSVNWIDENEGDIENGDTIEIITEVKNLGDEATTIKLYSYFPSRIAKIAFAPYNGENFKVTDGSGNLIDPSSYAEGFISNNWGDWPISVVGIGGLHLAPGASIIFYYKIVVKDKDTLILPPVEVQYDSRYPMAGASGMEGASEESGELSPSPMGISLKLQSKDEIPRVRFSIQQGDTGSSSWTSYSGSSLLAAYAAVSATGTDTTDQSDTTKSGVNGYTTLTSFINENMRLMIVVLAIPVLVLVVKERRRR
ncbi:MAG: hypothetical protein ACFE95_04890 [Candidatus Hodarchaeota archaeon]